MRGRLGGSVVGLLMGLAMAAPALAQQGDEYRVEINKGTVAIISGGITGTSIRIADAPISIPSRSNS